MEREGDFRKVTIKKRDGGVVEYYIGSSAGEQKDRLLPRMEPQQVTDNKVSEVNEG